MLSTLSRLTLVGFCIVISIVLVSALFFRAERLQAWLQFPLSLFSDKGVQSTIDLNQVDAGSALRAVEPAVGDEVEPDSSIQLLLEVQEGEAAGDESPLAGSNEEANCVAEDEACTGSFLELLPPEAAAANEKTILLLGVDSRNGGLISRTDTIMLLSIREQEQQISLLSIPRDLYVSIEGHGRDRINTALVHGAKEQDNDLEAGIALLSQTVERTLGIAIDHYVVVDFRAVVRSIDALGGIDVYVPYDINDPTFPDMAGGFDPLYIPAGQHHFAGEMALKYARTRHQDNDFYRAERQQQVLFAIRQQVLNLGVTELLGSAPTLYQQVRQGVFTDLSLAQMIQLGQTISNIPMNDIKTAVLDGEYVSNEWTEAGESVLILKPAAVLPLMRKMFTLKGTTATN
jgi:LCP family protein required for cell wall assembly